MNRANPRRQLDTSKPLIKVESADEFFNTQNEEAESLNPERINSTTSNNELKRKSTTEKPVEPGIPAIPVPKKNDIIIPVTKATEDPLKAIPDIGDVLYKKRKFQTHYVRMNYTNPVPSPEIYEVTDKDLQFIKELNEKVPKKNQHELTMQSFQKTIETWENITEKGDVITLSRALLAVESLFSAALKDQVTKIYEYWKNLRETYQRPLLRKYLKVTNKDDNNPNAAFRIREAPKMKTRRAQRTTETETLEKMRVLHQDLDVAITLIGNTKYREMLKLEVFELALLKFESSLKDKAENNKLVEKYKENYENETYIKMRNKMKEYTNKAANALVRYNEKPVPAPEPEPISTPSSKAQPKPILPMLQGNSEELNFDLGCFIATILEESLTKDITPLKVQHLDLPSFKESEPPVPLIPPEIAIARMPSKPPMLQAPETPKPVRMPIIEQKPQKPIPQPPIQPEDKGMIKYQIRKRLGRQNRVLLDRVYEEDDNNIKFRHNKDFYSTYPSHKDVLITPEVMQKLPSSNMRDLYVMRFGKFKEICPFNDSEEENDMTEANKMIKNLSTNFKLFMKQRRPSASVI